MTFRQFAFNNVFRNKRLYIAYFLTSLFTVMVFFTFANFAFHPVLSGDDMKESVMTGMTVAGGIIYVFSFFFILYSMSAFLQSRKKEFGVLMIQGMSSRQIRWMVFLENMIIGFFSTVIGIGLGALFSKAILLIAENVLIIEESLPFYFPWMAMGITFGSFIVLFLFISFFVTFILRTNKLVKLIKGDKIGKSEPKASIILTVLAILLLVSGYAIAVLVEGVFVAVALLPVVIMVTLGTYFLFSQISVFVIGRLKKNKRLFWKKTNMILFSDLSYRMKDNARAFFMVAIISTVAFSAIGTLVGMKTFLTKAFTETNPVSFVYYPFQDMDDAEVAGHLSFIESTLQEHNVETDKLQTALQYFKQGESSVLIMPISEYNAYNKLIGEKELSLVDDAPIKIVPKDMSFDVKTIEQSGGSVRRYENLDSLMLANGKEIKIEDSIVTNYVVPESYVFYVVSEADFAALGKAERIETPYLWQVSSGNEDDVIDAGKIMSDTYPMYIVPIDSTIYDVELVYGPIMFIGLFIGIIFFVSAGSFLYFRLYTDLDDDKAKFRAISKIGLTTGELKKVISRQTAILFFTPIIVALVHGAVALTALSHMFDYDLTRPSILVLGSFLSIQIVYYLVVRHFYIRQINRSL